MYARGTRSHIPQPPHSAGTPYKGLRAAIDPNQIPSPIDTIEADQERWDDQTYMTLPGKHPPLSTTHFIAVDQGNLSSASGDNPPRMSIWDLPSNSNLASGCNIPMTAIIQPFVYQDAREEHLPLVDTGGVGPARCKRRRAYEVMPEYFCNLDANMLRLDYLQRPELNKGTVDFAVPEEYWAPHPPPSIRPLYHSMFPEPTTGRRIPAPMDYVFAFDVSQEAVRTGFLQTACIVLIELLYGRDDTIPPYFPPSSRIAILAFDRTLQFYNLSTDVDGRLPMLVVPDVDDVRVFGLFVNPAQHMDAIINLLASLPSRHEQSCETEAALGSVLSAGLAALAGRGGQVVAFAATLRTIGVGFLQPLVDEAAVYSTEKAGSLFEPREEIWNILGVRCGAAGIGAISSA